MIRYGIMVVPPEWEEAMPLPFDQAVFDEAKLEQGTRILIYREGEGVVGEGEVAGYAVDPARWTPATVEHLPPSFAQADVLQPVRLLYTREDALTPDEVRQALEQPDFPHGHGRWQALERDAYARLADWPS